MADLDYFVEQNQIYGPSGVDNSELKGFTLDNLLNNSLDEGDGDFAEGSSALLSANKRQSKMDNNGNSGNNSSSSSSGLMAAPCGVMGMGLGSSTITPSMNILKGEGAGSMYDEAAIEAAAEIAMLASISTERKFADQLVKAILTDNLPLLNSAAISIISSNNQHAIGAGRMSLPPMRLPNVRTQ